MEQDYDTLDFTTNNAGMLRYVGFGKRFIAFIIDSVLMGIAVNIAVWGFGIEDTGFYTGSNGLLYWIYYAVLESSDKQATLGKQALNIRVGDADGNRISFMNATGRYFAKILSAVILFIGFIMIIFDDKKQGLHDKLANTYVVED
jgi:uncharacterized RDD family membrane protein YckC